jgi:RNA polymerase sigma-70 factor, ECF subfamily
MLTVSRPGLENGPPLENVLIFQAVAQETGLSLPPKPAAIADEDWQHVEALLRGSLPAFERLYQQHGGRMKSIACNLMGNTSDAEDAVQESFLKVYRSIRSFQGHSSLSTWIYRILVNTCLDLKRKRRRQELPESSSSQEDIPHPQGLTANHPLRLTLEKIVARLDERLRNVFLLFEVEGFRHSEIAGMLNISEAASKVALFQAKRELRGRLARSQHAARNQQ